MDFDFDTSSILDVLILDPGTGNLTIGGSKSIIVPKGTELERPTGLGSNGAGAIRFNTDNSSVEYWDGANWQTIQTQAGGSGALSNFANMTTPGIIVQTTSGNYAARSIQETVGQTSVTNGDGVNGDPTIGLATAGTAGTYASVTTDAYGRVTSGSTTQAWSTITGTPTTLAGYGITNAYTMAQTANLTWAWSSITSTPTTLAGYGITDAASDSDLSTHAGDFTLHLTSAQNSFLDNVTVTSTEVNHLSGASSNIQDQIDGKLSLTGGTLSGNLIMDPGSIVMITTAPSAATDAVNKNYVDNLVSGLTWKVPVDSVGISLPGTATTGERFLNTVDSKIYTATATDTWDAGVSPADGWTVFTRDTETGYVYSGSEWVQFTGAGQIAAGIGLNKTGNQININLGAGISELPTDEVGIDLHSASGMFLTIDGSTSSTATNAQLKIKADGSSIAVSANGIKVAANAIGVSELSSSVAGTGLTGGSGNALSLSTVGSAGTYNSVTTDAYGRVTSGNTIAYLTGNQTITVSGDASGSGTTSIPLTLANVGTSGTYVSVTTDSKGRVISGNTTQAWSTITSTPTTLSGYGITDAVKNNGSVPSFQSGTLAARPAAGTAGAMYVTTDTAAIYRDSGSAWVQVGEAGLLYTENANVSILQTSTVTGDNAVSIGSGNTASGKNVLATGVGSKSAIYGAEVRASGSISAAGDAQSGKYVLRAATTTSAVTELYADGVGEQLVLPNNTTWAYSAYITGRRTDATGSNAGFKIEGVVTRNASAATTALVGTRSRTILTRPNTNWIADVSVDSSTGALTFTVQGENGKTVRWVATVITSEVSN
jgi:hypothetical protein